MSEKRNSYGLAVIALVVLQTLILGWMVWDRVSILNSPDVVTLKSEPVDPRDLFRGDYVTLTYGISRLDLHDLKDTHDWRKGDTIFVELTPAQDNWRAASIHTDNVTPTPGNRIVRGHVRYTDGDGKTISVDYGIERYYVPEGEGRKLEDERNKRALSVDIAIAKSGEAAIKGIRIDGQPIYEEPLF